MQSVIKLPEELLKFYTAFASAIKHVGCFLCLFAALVLLAQGFVRMLCGFDGYFLKFSLTHFKAHFVDFH